MFESVGRELDEGGFFPPSICIQFGLGLSKQPAESTYSIKLIKPEPSAARSNCSSGR